LDETERAGVFEGQMRRLRGAERMQMRFTLQARTPERDRWSSVNAAGFGTWVSSAPGTSRYVYTKRVEGLLAPASYRVLLRFRWLDAGGEVVERARAYSRTCRQPDPRANLVVGSIGVQPAVDPARRRYVVFVRNSGRTDSEPFSLAVSVDGEPLPPAPVFALAPGEGTLVTVEGPACVPGAPIDAEADAGEVVDERTEADNRLTQACPAPS
ncbi:MAG: CARDB domain-containing protein, partial [Solirubrobacteraceae bacterium]